jgi:hypothetical protein
VTFVAKRLRTVNICGTWALKFGARGVVIKRRKRIAMNDVVTVAEQLYYEANPNTKMDIPSFAYEQVESANKRRIAAQSKLSLYDWCKQELD